MGMFTSIVHPDDGRELQIKTGHDLCDTYAVGDEVHWSIENDYPGQGTLLDGAYPSFSGRDSDRIADDDWVIIKNHRVLCVAKVSPDVRREDVEKMFHVVPWLREWWPESVWLKHDIQKLEQRISDAREELEALKWLDGKSDEDIAKGRHEFLVRQSGALFRSMLNRESFARQVFAPQAVKGAPEDETPPL